MALTPIQRQVLRLLADRRGSGGESYIAGGVALNDVLATQRISRDVDLFRDTAEAVARSVDQDRDVLSRTGIAVTVLRERVGYVEAAVSHAGDTLVLEWARDSAFRFFPLVSVPDVEGAAGLLVIAVAARTRGALSVPEAPPVADMAEYRERALHIAATGTLYGKSWRMPGYWPALAFKTDVDSTLASRGLNVLAAAVSAQTWGPPSAFAEAPADRRSLGGGWSGGPPCGIVVALFATDESRAFVVARGAGVTAVDAGRVVRALTARCGGKGGGKPDLAQGGGLTAPMEEALGAARELLN